MGIHCLGTSRQTRQLQENHAMEFTLGIDFEPQPMRIRGASPTLICCEKRILFFNSFLVAKVLSSTQKVVNVESNSVLGTQAEVPILGLNYR